MPERVYEHELVADEHGEMAVALVNDHLPLGVELRWLASELPCFNEWLHLREGAYAIGVEPCTHHIAGDQAARDDGSMTWLEPGESRTYRLAFTVLPDDLRTAESEARIRAASRGV